MNEFIVKNSDLCKTGISYGDTLIFDESEPAEGDFILIEHNGKQYLAWFIGKDFVGNYIICDCYVDHPRARTLFKPDKYKIYRVSKHLKGAD